LREYPEGRKDMPASPEPNTVWTIGHSNRSWKEFLALLVAERIESVADVRRFPGSRRCPHFGHDALAASLQSSAIQYVHFPELGGRRSAHRDDSPNTAWRVEAFRAYADYASTPEFTAAFEALAELATQQRTAIMCAEALPWRCHRRLIADQFVARGWRVLDIVGPGQAKEHALPPFAKVVGGSVTYPGETLF
jgi:uncharacterized protein (DUF488 family)